MKYLFFLLILVNIVFFLWETGVGRPTTTPGQATPSTEERIVLLKELPETPGKNPPTLANDPAPLATPGQMSSTQAVGTAAATKTPAQQGEEPQKGETCHWLGPFATLNKAQTTQKTLGTSIGQAKPMKRPTEVENGYLILYPAAASLQEAQANRTMLQEKGFKDAWVLDNEENRYAISLAVVHNKDRADEALARYQKQGIPAELKPRKAQADRWWLEIRGNTDPTSLEALANQGDTGPTHVGVKDCDSTARSPLQ